MWKHFGTPSKPTQHHGQKGFQGNNIGPELEESWHEKQVGRAGEGEEGNVEDEAETDEHTGRVSEGTAEEGDLLVEPQQTQESDRQEEDQEGDEPTWQLSME